MIDLEEISKTGQFVESIIQFLRGTTGINFQKNVMKRYENVALKIKLAF